MRTQPCIKFDAHVNDVADHLDVPVDGCTIQPSKGSASHVWSAISCVNASMVGKLQKNPKMMEIHIIKKTQKPLTGIWRPMIGIWQPMIGICPPLIGIWQPLTGIWRTPMKCSKYVQIWSFSHDSDRFLRHAKLLHDEYHKWLAQAGKFHIVPIWWSACYLFAVSLDTFTFFSKCFAIFPKFNFMVFFHRQQGICLRSTLDTTMASEMTLETGHSLSFCIDMNSWHLIIHSDRWGKSPHGTPGSTEATCHWCQCGVCPYIYIISQMFGEVYIIYS